MMNENGTQPQAIEPQAQIEVPFDVPEGYRLMTDAEADLMAAHIVESRQEQWEIQEIVDSAVVAGEMNALMRSELYYEYTQGGKTVRGLTAKMIGHLATAQGISEVIEFRKSSGDAEAADKYEFEVVVEMPDPHNPQRMLYRTGYAEEPKEAYGKYDKFAKAKAHTKAYRNACLKFLPQDLIMATTFKLANLVPADWRPKPQRAALPAPENTEAMNTCFAAFGKQEQELLSFGVNKKKFWETLKIVLGVESRNDMTEQQWKDVARDLNTLDFGEIVRDVLVKCGVNLVDLEGEPERF